MVYKLHLNKTVIMGKTFIIFRKKLGFGKVFLTIVKKKSQKTKSFN